MVDCTRVDDLVMKECVKCGSFVESLWKFMA